MSQSERFCLGTDIIITGEQVSSSKLMIYHHGNGTCLDGPDSMQQDCLPSRAYTSSAHKGNEEPCPPLLVPVLLILLLCSHCLLGNNRLSTFALSASWGTCSASCPLNGVALPASTPGRLLSPSPPRGSPHACAPFRLLLLHRGSLTCRGTQNQSEGHASMLLTKLLAGDKKVVVVSPPRSPFS